MTIITEQGFEISDSDDGRNGRSGAPRMSRKAKKRAAAKARRDAAAKTAEAADAEMTETEEMVDAETETEETVDAEVSVEDEAVEADDTAEAEAVEAEEVAEGEVAEEVSQDDAEDNDTDEDIEPEALEDVEADEVIEDTEVEENESDEDAEFEVEDEVEVGDEDEVEDGAEDPEAEAAAAEADEDMADVEDLADPESVPVDELVEGDHSEQGPIAEQTDVPAPIEVETEAAIVPEPAAVPPVRADVPAVWTGRQMAAVAQRALAVFVVLGLVGYGLGFVRGGSNTARAEFVYTLDESVPDSFLREDRRLLTQVVTFKSDAVLTPVADEFNLTVDELRSKIDVDTLNLSEVLRLDVVDADANRAVALNQAVLDQYLRVIADASPAGDGEELADRRADISAELETADAARLGLLETQEQDVTLQLQQESLQQRISVKNAQIGVLQQELDAAVIDQVGATVQATVANTLAAAEADLVNLEAQLLAVGTLRAELATATRAEPALLREIERLEAKLTTIDNELAERELAPLVASPIRELSDPIVLSTSRHFGGLQGMALGILVAMPIGALVAYRARKRQLWFD